jgi:hypothetical protein
MKIRPFICAAAAATATTALLVVGGAALASTPKGGLKLSVAFISTPGDGPGGCTNYASPANTSTCHVTLTNPSSSNEKVTWVAGVTGDVQDYPTTFTPDLGTLAPGKSVKVTIVTGECGLQGFYFIAGNYGGSVLYSCG